MVQHSEEKTNNGKKEKISPVLWELFP